MQFQVPQYIDVEDKLFGNFTFKQFLYIVGGVGGAYFAWNKLPVLFGIPLALMIAGVAFSLAFLPDSKFGVPFSKVLEAGFRFLLKPRLYLWRRVPEKVTPQMLKKKQEERKRMTLNMPSISDSKLKDMSWGLDVKADPVSEK